MHLADRISLPKPVLMLANEVLPKSLHWLDATESDPSFSDLKRAIYFRAGLMIAFLISRPVRRRSLLSMTTDQHLCKTADGFDIHLAAEDMKDKKARWFPLPKFLVHPKVSYLGIDRPILLRSNTSNAIWITSTENRSHRMVCLVSYRMWRSACWALNFNPTSFVTLRPPAVLSKNRNMSISSGISSGTRRWTCPRSTIIAPPGCQPVLTTNRFCGKR